MIIHKVAIVKMSFNLVGVSFGDVAVCFVGNDDFRHYVTNGKAVESVNLAEKFCTSGDVVFSPSAWPHIRNLNIPHTICADGEHVYVHEVCTMITKADALIISGVAVVKKWLFPA